MDSTVANRIDATLQKLRAAGRQALAPFATIGFPDVDTSIDLIEGIAEAGGDMVEIAVPFSDPMAEGPTTQMTSQVALEHGVSVGVCLEAVRTVRGRGLAVPLVLMGYYNPFLRYGTERFVRDAADSGADGLIVPDLPWEESGHLRDLCNEHGLYLIPLLAPTSTDDRMAKACQDARGFIYCVSLTGVTGARENLSSAVAGLVQRIRRHTDLPVLVGFGVSKRSHVEEIGRYADGAIVGSAMLKAIDEAPREKAVEAAQEFVRGLRTSPNNGS